MLPFTSEILFSSFAVYNRELWPLPIAALLLALVAVVLAIRPVRHGGRIAAGLLAAGWLWTGYGYFFLHHAQLNFAAPIFAFFFILQGLLLSVAFFRGRLSFRFQRDPASWAGLALALMVLLVLPFADWLTSGDWQGARIVGLTPGPTALFTLGMLLLTVGRTPIHLTLIPLLWTLVAGATAWALTMPHDLAMPVAGVLATTLVVWKNRSA